MNYREAALYTNKSKIEIKSEFEYILEAMEAMGKNRSISSSLLDFWLYGSIPVNYYIYMEQLNASKLLQEHGISGEHIKSILSDNAPIDKYLLFKNVCLNFVGEELTHDFQSLIIDPINKIIVEPSQTYKSNRLEKLQKAKKVIVSVSPSLTKVTRELEKIEPHFIGGTVVETILIKLQQIEFLIENQIKE